MYPKVTQMTGRTGEPVANQFVISDASTGRHVFQSYKTTIVVIERDGCVLLDAENWDCSWTTIRYRNQFLGETSDAIKAKINSGEYKLVNLN